MNQENQPQDDARISDHKSKPENKRVICSDEIFQGQREIIILHEGDQYRLRQTRNGKLILHK